MITSLCRAVALRAAQPVASLGFRGWGGQTYRLWRAREREPIRGSGGSALSGVWGQSPWSGGLGDEVPLKLKLF